MMGGTSIKEWKPGTADFYWKQAICYRDMIRVQEAVQVIEHILGGPISDYSGSVIKSACNKHIESSLISLKRGASPIPDVNDKKENA